MNRLLTIAIPTFNRHDFLEKQFVWLEKAIKGFESECEILISDNCSTDNTPQLIEEWQSHFSATPFVCNRNSVNTGLMRNFAYCLKTPKTKYVWVLGDDDVIQDGTLDYVINNLKQHPDLSLLLLDFSIRSIATNEIVHDNVFHIDFEEVHSDGQALIEHHLVDHHMGLGFIAATVYSTESVQLALKTWPQIVDNLEGQLYWSAFAALHGSVKISKEVFIEYASNMLFQTNPKIWFSKYYANIIEVYVQLIKLGYNSQLIRKLILRHFITNNWRVVLGAIRRWPVQAITTMIYYFSVVASSAFISLLKLCIS